MEKMILYPLLLGLTIVCYFIGVQIRKRSGVGWLHPLLTASLMIIAVILAIDIPYGSYEAANTPMRFLMDISVVSLGWLLYDRIEDLKKSFLPILVCSFIGSLVAMGTVSAVFAFTGTPEDFVVSVVPKSITAPIAVRLAEYQGGMVSVTAVSVFLTGVFGALVAPFFLGLVGVKDPAAVGLAIGCSSHAVGTSRAVELGAVEGAVSGLALGLTGAMTALIYPIYTMLFY